MIHGQSSIDQASGINAVDSRYGAIKLPSYQAIKLYRGSIGQHKLGEFGVVYCFFNVSYGICWVLVIPKLLINDS